MNSSDTILYDVEQGSEAWHRARAGHITASKVSMIRERLKSGPNKGGFSMKAMDLAFRLAIERITGMPLDDDEFSPWQGDRGVRLEPEARAKHEAREGVIVLPLGFAGTSDKRYGVSVDGLLGDDGGAEYKAFLSPSKLRSILLEGDWSDVIEQAQFGMAITGRKRWTMGLYCPALEVIGRELTLKTVERDDDLIEAIWKDLLEFDGVVERYRAQLTQADVIPAQTTKPVDPPKPIDPPKPAARVEEAPAF